jgi:Fic family protein
MKGKPHWNWEKRGWPTFRYDGGKLAPLEAEFLQKSGIFIGAALHVADEEKQLLTVDLMANEALETSEIEGQ